LSTKWLKTSSTCRIGDIGEAGIRSIYAPAVAADGSGGSLRLNDVAGWVTIAGTVCAPIGAGIGALIERAISGDWEGSSDAVGLGLAVGFAVGAIVGLLISWARYREGGGGESDRRLDDTVARLRGLMAVSDDDQVTAPVPIGPMILDPGLRAILRKPGTFAGWSIAARTTVRLRGLPAYFRAHDFRLVLLGEPGSGKSLATRILQRDLNREDNGEAWVAEIFPLGSWPEWRRRHADSPIEDWIADHLALKWGVSGDVGTKLLLSGRLIPLFDGLDEVSGPLRSDCVEELNRLLAMPAVRRFVVCCRSSEYVDLAPQWVDPASRPELVLQPLLPRDILRHLEELPPGQGWGPTSEALRREARDEAPWPDDAGRRPPSERLQNPLHLVIALRAYRGADPGELCALDHREAVRTLWKRYLQATYGSSDRYPYDQATAWLSNIARMQSQTFDRAPEFWLHSLYRVDSDRRLIKRWRLVLGLIGAGIGLLIGLLLKANDIYMFSDNQPLRANHQPILGTLFGYFIGSALIDGKPQRLSWAGMRRLEPWRIAAIGIASIASLVLWTLVGSNVFTLPFLGFIVFIYFMTSLTSEVDDTQARRLRAGEPYTVLRNAFWSGLFVGAISYVLSYVVSTALRDAAGIHNNVTSLWLLYCLVPAVLFAFASGIDSVVWHFLLRVSLASESIIPLRLVDFLDWASSPTRGWLTKVNGSYRFAHRELQELLPDLDTRLPAPLPERPPAPAAT
jgi:hypothetical protein